MLNIVENEIVWIQWSISSDSTDHDFIGIGIITLRRRANKESFSLKPTSLALGRVLRVVVEKLHVGDPITVTRKKSPNVYKSCPNDITIMIDFDTFTKIA